MKTSNMILLTNPSSEKLATITDNYNELAISIGKKPVKKFRDKPTAIRRHGEISELYLNAMDAQQAKAGKPAAKIKDVPTTKLVPVAPTKAKPSKSSKYDLSGTLKVTSNYVPKLHSINEFIMERIEMNLGGNRTGEGMVVEIVEYFRKPSDSSTVDVGFARTSIIWLIKEGHITLTPLGE